MGGHLQQPPQQHQVLGTTTNATATPTSSQQSTNSSNTADTASVLIDNQIQMSDLIDMGDGSELDPNQQQQSESNINLISTTATNVNSVVTNQSGLTGGNPSEVMWVYESSQQM